MLIDARAWLEENKEKFTEKEEIEKRIIINNE